MGLLYFTNEEGKWQNRLENAWVMAVAAKEATQTRLSVFVSSVAQITGVVFDKLFGDRLISFRAIGVSVCYSIASIALLGILDDTRKGVRSPGWFMFLGFVILGTFPAFTEKHKRIFWGWGCFTKAFFSLSIMLIFLTSWSFRLHHFDRLLFAPSLLLVLMVFASFLYIALTRRMLRQAAKTTSSVKTVGIILLDIIVWIVLVLTLILLWSLVTNGRLVISRPTMTAVRLGQVFLVSLNLLDAAACSLFLFLAVLILLQRLIWPLIERTLYACARFEVIQNKKLLWSFGMTLLFGPQGIEAMKALLGKI